MTTSGNEILKLYTMPGGLHCQQAESLLKEAGIGFTKVDIVRQGELSAVGRDLGVRKLPGSDRQCRVLRGHRADTRFR